MTRRVGLFGGTFDPVHNAHVALARAAVEALALDELRWVPAGQPWQKDGEVTPALHREAMVRLAIAGEPRQALERCEIERGGASYTIDTVRQLSAAEPGVQWVLVIGADQHAGLHTWHEWPELLQRVTLAVASRPGPQAPAEAPGAQDANPAPGAQDAEAAPGAQDAAAAPGARRAPHPDVLRHGWLTVPLPPLDVSSSDVRRRVRAGQDISALVPPPVARYIETHRLYRGRVGS